MASSELAGRNDRLWQRRIAHHGTVVSMNASGDCHVSQPELVVLLGAGASHRAASDPLLVDRSVDSRPPLTTGLFSQRYVNILHGYPLAEQAAPKIRRALESGVMSLERYLRTELRDADHRTTTAQYQEIPLYLQHVLWDRSQPRAFATQPDNLTELVTDTLRAARVTFVTLNYDTILDRLLAAYDPIVGMDSYVRPDLEWALLKLHGSVDWGYRIGPVRLDPRAAPSLRDALRTFHDPLQQLDSTITFRGGANNLDEMRREVTGPTSTHPMRNPGVEYFYPALAAPLGPPDELICPPEHVQFLQDRIGEMYDGLNLLVIGYSAIDPTALEVLTKPGRKLRKLLVVDREHDSANTIAGKLCDAFGMQANYAHFAYHGDFDHFVAHRGLAKFLEEIKLP